MGLFGKKEEGGFMDVIRCDEQEYLVWKWRPSGEANSTNKENSIRFGSSLRVKDGEMAVFVYQQKDGSMQDYIVGPYDQTIKTANFPILTGIVGAAFGGASPFQAEIYFINLSGNIQVKFGIPYFDVFDPRFLDFAVPMAARGTITFNLTDYKSFIKLNRLINFELDDFNKQIKDAVTKYVKSVITNLPSEVGMPVLQIERKILDINDLYRIDTICLNYIESIKFTFLYYFDKCPSWKHYYRYNYSPTFYDIYSFILAKPKDFINNLNIIDNTIPFHYYEQLLAVLPPSSSNLLPKNLANLMTSIDSEIIEYYPINYDLITYHKKKMWECIPNIPQYDINILQNIINKYI